MKKNGKTYKELDAQYQRIKKNIKNAISKANNSTRYWILTDRKDRVIDIFLRYEQAMRESAQYKDGLARYMKRYNPADGWGEHYRTINAECTRVSLSAYAPNLINNH